MSVALVCYGTINTVDSGWNKIDILILILVKSWKAIIDQGLASQTRPNFPS